MNNLKNYSKREEKANYLTHGFGVLIAIVATLLLLNKSISAQTRVRSCHFPCICPAWNAQPHRCLFPYPFITKKDAILFLGNGPPTPLQLPLFLSFGADSSTNSESSPYRKGLPHDQPTTQK